MASRYATPSSYYVAVFPTKERDSWYWEIRRKRKPMGVTLREGGFRTSEDAELAGKQVLEEFLNGLSIQASSK